MKYVIYTRVSTDEQDLSLEAQKENAIKFVDGAEHVFFEEKNISGVLPLNKKPVLMMALESLNKEDILLVVKMDRLTRDLWQLGLIQTLVQKKGASVISITEPEFGKDDPQSQMMSGMKAVFAQYEAAIIAIRTKTVMQSMKSKGMRVGYIPFGYRVDDKNMLHEDEFEQQVINKIIILLEDCSLRKVAEEMNRQKIYNRGRPWNHVSLHTIRHNRLRKAVH